MYRHVLQARLSSVVIRSILSIAWLLIAAPVLAQTLASTWTETPGSVLSLTNIVSIAGGPHHTIARESDNTIWTWGGDGHGHSGNASSSSDAVRMPAEQNAVASTGDVGAGDASTFAVTTEGIVYVSGLSYYSQLGDGTTTTRHVPTAISDTGYAWKVSQPALSESSGTYTTNRTVTIAVIRYTQNGSERHTGASGSGRLGDGSTDSTTLPLKLSGISAVVAVDDGNDHTIAPQE